MVSGLIVFLLLALVIVVVLAVFGLVMKKVPMDADVKQIAWLIIGLVALVALILAACHAFGVNTGVRL